MSHNIDDMNIGWGKHTHTMLDYDKSVRGSISQSPVPFKTVVVGFSACLPAVVASGKHLPCKVTAK